MGAKPTVLVIGAMRAGTTTLHDFLGRHPDVWCSPVKEPHRFGFDRPPVHAGPGDRAFDQQLVLDQVSYEKLFAPGSGSRHRVESSAMYLYLPGTVERIDRELDDVRLIAVLRDPVERAWSGWSYQRMRMFEPVDDFAEALGQEADRISQNWAPIWHYWRAGQYADQLASYRERFGERLHVAFFEDMRADPAAFTNAIAKFLDLDPVGFPGTLPRTNPSGIPRLAGVQRLLQSRPGWFSALRRRFPGPVVRAGRAVRAWNTGIPVPVDASLVARLRRQAAPGIAALEDILGRSVPPGWRA